MNNYNSYTEEELKELEEDEKDEKEYLENQRKVNDKLKEYFNSYKFSINILIIVIYIPFLIYYSKIWSTLDNNILFWILFILLLPIVIIPNKIKSSVNLNKK